MKTLDPETQDKQDALQLLINGCIFAPSASALAKRLGYKGKTSIYRIQQGEASAGAIEEAWDKLFDLRDDVMKALELARAEKLIGKSLDAKVTIYADGEAKDVLSAFVDELATVFITSQAVISTEAAPENAFKDTTSSIAVLVETADGEKCDRCWMYSVNTVSDGEGCVCERCKGVLGI